MAVIRAGTFWQLRRTPAVARLIVANNALLFACVSMYLGTGWRKLRRVSRYVA